MNWNHKFPLIYKIAQKSQTSQTLENIENTKNIKIHQKISQKFRKHQNIKKITNMDEPCRGKYCVFIFWTIFDRIHFSLIELARNRIIIIGGITVSRYCGGYWIYSAMAYFWTNLILLAFSNNILFVDKCSISMILFQISSDSFYVNGNA